MPFYGYEVGRYFVGTYLFVQEGRRWLAVERRRDWLRHRLLECFENLVLAASLSWGNLMLVHT